MSKGIIIDVGFKADIKDFIKDIENDLQKVDFDSVIGLSESFDKQAKDVKDQLSKLKKEIDETINGKLPNNPNKQLQSLNKAVNILSSSFKELVKNTPNMNQGMLGQLDEITNEVGQLSDVCANAVHAVKDLQNAASGDIQFVDTKQLDYLEKLYKEFGKVEKEAEKLDKTLKKSGKNSYKDEDEVLKDIKAFYTKYADIEEKIFDIEESGIDSSEKVKQLDILKREYAQMTIYIQRLLNTFMMFDGADMTRKISFGDSKISLGNIRQEMERGYSEVFAYIAQRKADIQEEVYHLGGSNLADVVGDINESLNKNSLTVPIDISTKSSTLLKRAMTVIHTVQEKLEDNPLMLQVALVSPYKTKRNEEIFEQISSQLSNIDDEKIKSQISSLLEHMEYAFGNELRIKIGITGSEKVSSTVKELLSELQSEIDHSDFTIYPDINLTQEVKDKIQSDINALSNDIVVNIGIKDDDDGQNSTKKEIQNLSQLKKKIDEIITAVEHKNAAFQIEEQIVDGVIQHEISTLQELIGWINLVIDDIKNIGRAIVQLPNFSIIIDQNSIQKIEELKNSGILDDLTSYLKNDLKIELENIQDKVDIEMNLDDAEFKKNLAIDLAELAKIPKEKTVTIHVKNPSTMPLISDKDGKEIVTFYKGVKDRFGGQLTHSNRWTNGVGNETNNTFSTSDTDTAKSYGNKMYRRNLAGLNLLEVDTNGSGWTNISEGLDELIDVAKRKLEDFQEQFDAFSAAGYTKEADKVLNKIREINHFLTEYRHTTDEIGSVAELLGYDSVLFDNIYDGAGLTQVAIVFDDEQVRNASTIVEKFQTVKSILDSMNKEDYITKTGLESLSSVISLKEFKNNDIDAFKDYFENEFYTMMKAGLEGYDDDQKIGDKEFSYLIEEAIRVIINAYKHDTGEYFYNRDDFQKKFTKSFKEKISKVLSAKNIPIGWTEVESELDNNPFNINLDISKATSQLKELQEKIDSLPDTKNIKINVLINGGESLTGEKEFFKLELSPEELKDFNTLVETISNIGVAPGRFFKDLTNGFLKVEDFDDELKEVFEKIGFIKDGVFDFKAIEHGMASARTNSGVAITDDFTIIARILSRDLPKVEDLIPKLKEAKKLGANVCTILDKIDDKDNDLFYEIQETGKGKGIGLQYDKNPNLEFLNATDEQINKLIEDIKILNKLGLSIDTWGDNILYDKEKGFSFIDLGTNYNLQNNPACFKNTPEDVFDAYFANAYDYDFSKTSTFESRFLKILQEGIPNSVKKIENKENSIEINIEPKVNAEDFANKVTSQLQGVSAQINVDPIYSHEPDNNIKTEKSDYDEIYNKLIELRNLYSNTPPLFDIVKFTEHKKLIAQLEGDLNLNEKGITLSSDSTDEELKTIAKSLETVNEQTDKMQTTHISVNLKPEEVQSQVNSIIDEINRIPERKDVVVDIKTTDYSGIEELSDRQGNIVKFYRGVNDVYNGINSSHYNGTFLSSKIEIAKSYAGELGKVYEETVKFKNALEIDAKGSDWASVLYLGDGTNKESSKITSLYKDMTKYMSVLEAEIKASNISLEEKEDLISNLHNLLGNSLNETFSFNIDLSGAKDSWIEEFEYFTEGLKEAGIQSKNTTIHLDLLKDTAEEFKKISDNTDNIFGVHTTDEYLKYAEKFGYDGIIIKNVYDDAQMQFNELSDVIAVLYENQISSAKIVRESENANLNVIDQKTDAFKEEGSTVDEVVNGEIKKLDELEKKLGTVTDAVNAKTEAFENEGKVVGEVIDGEVAQLNPLQNLESVYNIFKPFYDKNDLESEEGAKAALSYYNAYKEALASKVNKKDLKQYTVGKESDLFTGNYANYKKGTEELDLSGLNSQISKYEVIVEKFNQPEVISIVNALTEAIQKLLDAGNTSDKATKLLTELNKAINNLGGKTSADKIAKIATNLENFQKSIQALDLSDSNFINSLSSILDKGEELKALGEVLKSTKKQIDEAGKAVKAQDNLKQSQKYLEQHENDIRSAVNNKFGGENVLYQKLDATKDGVVQITAMVQEGENAYKKYILTATNGSDLMVKATNDNAAAISKEIKQWKAYQKLKELAVPGARNLGEEGVTFTPDSENWGQLVEKAHEFGIEVKDIVKIMRNVDEIGQESFQIFTKLSRVTVGMDSNGVLFQKDEVLDINKLVNDFIKNVDNLQKSLGGSFKGDDKAIQTFLNNLKEIQYTWKAIGSLHEKGLISDETISSLSQYFNSFKTTISAISLDKISTDKKTPEFLEQLELAKTKLISLQDVIDKVNTGQMISDNDIVQIKSFIEQVRTLYSTMGDKENNLSKTDSVDKLLKKITKNLKENSAMSKDLKRRFRELAAEMINLGDSIPKDQFEKFTAQFNRLDREMWEGKTGLSFFDGVIQRAKSMSKSFISMYLSLWDIVRYIRTGVGYIKELDTALTEMRKVSDESISSLKKFQKESFDIANSVGTTAVQIQNSTADWMRLGESIEEATESARVSNILLNVSEFESINEATDSLVAMSSAYQELDKMDIVDKLNEVGNNYAIATDGIATALQRSASALTTAGNDMDEAVALVTAGNAVVQDPDSVGAGLRTIALRLTGTKAAKKELEELGEETDGVVTTVSKLRDTIMSATAVASNGFKGFDILDENGNYKSTYEIMKGISKIYQEIVETDKKTGSNNMNLLLETMAGKNRSNIAASILQNNKLLESVYESSANESEGSAEEELEKYLDSIEGKIAQFKNEVQEFWYNLISSKTIKGFIDFGTKAIDILGNITDFLGEIGTLATVAGAALGVHLLKDKSGGRAKVCVYIRSQSSSNMPPNKLAER